MPTYRVEYLCHRCGESHRVVEELRSDGAWPDSAGEGGSLDQLFPAGDPADEFERLLGRLVWCDEEGDWIELEDPSRVFVVPSASPA
jgi:hypothetical protein